MEYYINNVTGMNSVFYECGNLILSKKIFKKFKKFTIFDKEEYLIYNFKKN